MASFAFSLAEEKCFELIDVAHISCHRKRKIHLPQMGGKRTRTAGFVGGRYPNVLAGPGYDVIYECSLKVYTNCLENDQSQIFS